MKSAGTIVRTSLSFALVVLARFAAASPVLLPFQQIDTVDPHRQSVFAVDAGLVGEPLSQFASTTLRPAVMGRFSLSGGSGDPYAAQSGRSKYLVIARRTADVLYYYYALAAIGELLDGTTTGVSVIVGIDANDDGVPQASEARCAMTGTAASPARCILGSDALLGPDHSIWVMAVAPEASGSYEANLSAGVAEATGALAWSNGNYSGDQTSVTGPPDVPAGGAFSLTMTRSVDAVPLVRYYGALLLGGSDLTYNLDAVLPFALEQATADPILIDPVGGAVDVTPFQTPTAILTLQPGAAHRRLFFDLPASSVAYGSLAVSARVVSGGVPKPAPNLDLALVREDFAPASRLAVVDAAPTDRTPAARWNVDTNDDTVSAVLAQPQGGRWYLVATNRGTDPVAFVAYLSSTNAATAAIGRGANPLIAPGQYFNPRRSGHGLTLSRGADQQLLLWYTYLEDGTPTWYIAQSHTPAADTGWWTAPLYSVVRQNGAGVPTQIGYVEVAPTGENRFTFTWYIGADHGSEAFERLSPVASCPQLGGVTRNLTGNWFAPAQSGYGVDVVALPDSQFDIFYFYDAAGAARWGIGAAPFAATSTIDMLQSTGFCPLCTWSAVTTQALGPLTMTFNDASTGRLATDFTLKPPLSGSWSVDQPTLRLTGDAACE